MGQEVPPKSWKYGPAVLELPQGQDIGKNVKIVFKKNILRGYIDQVRRNVSYFKLEKRI